MLGLGYKQIAAVAIISIVTSYIMDRFLAPKVA